RCGDIDGVWIEPVTAQVMMTLRVSAMSPPLVDFGLVDFAPVGFAYLDVQSNLFGFAFVVDLHRFEEA
ncbi:MAG TPA: hypothetical protein VFB75_00230, partial [Burkholderiales bacterium]|nr:hypothetical protein [Burkholderiales bacterium]